jgi:HEAT repeat protein
LDDQVQKLYNEKMKTLREAYCEALSAQWKMLDFRGIMHVDMNNPISIPLKDVFILPDVLAEPLPSDCETLPREDNYEYRIIQKILSNEIQQDNQQTLVRPTQNATTSGRWTRIDFLAALGQHKQLIVLGDPGAGKTTLLRYLLLQIISNQKSVLKNIPDNTLFIPFYISLSSYTEICLHQQKNNIAFDEFIPLYLQEYYLERFTDFIQEALANKQIFFLLDGLDEITDRDHRVALISQLKKFTDTHEGNYFVITSRIVGYKNILPSPRLGYTEYTLADFAPSQIKMFTDQWCLAYEIWVKGEKESTQIKESAKQESEQLFEATQHNEGVRRLALNPLLLTILALIQRQGVTLPGHRAELFDLCATTLLDTWLTAKGYSRDSRMSKNDMVKLLRPLAFWMHEQSDVNIITKEQLETQIKELLGTRNITPNGSSIDERMQHFLNVVRGKTGILVEKGKDQFGFLHLTFEEYFAARELIVRKDRKEFIKQHLHVPHWREVILLATGIIGIQLSDEDGVTDLIQEAILKAKSPYERWLQRDLLFAGYCAADDISMSVSCEDSIIEQIVYHFLTSPYHSLGEACEKVFSTWRGTPIARKAEGLIVPLLTRQISPPSSNDTLADFSSRDTYFEKKILTRYQQLIQQQQKALTTVLHLQLKVISHNLGIDVPGDYTDSLSLLSNSSWKVRQIAATSLAQLCGKQPEVLSALLTALSDPYADVRRATALALVYIEGEPTVIDALLDTLSDPAAIVRQEAVKTLGRLGSSDTKVLKALLDAFYDPYDDVKRDAAFAIGLLAPINDPSILETLLSLLSNTRMGSSIREAAAIALGRLGKGNPNAYNALLNALIDETLDDPAARQAIATSLGYLTRDNNANIVSLLTLFHDSTEPYLRSAVITALGYLNSEDSDILSVFHTGLSDKDFSVRENTANVLGKSDVSDPSILKRLQDLANNDEDLHVRRAAATSLRYLEQQSSDIQFLYHTLDRQPVITAQQNAKIDDPQMRRDLQNNLLAILADLDVDLDTRKATALAIEDLCKKHTDLKTYLLDLSRKAPIDWLTTDKSIALYATKIYNEALLRNITLLGYIGSSNSQVIKLLQLILDDNKNADIRKGTITSLSKLNLDYQNNEDTLIRNGTIASPNASHLDHLTTITETIIRALSDLQTKDEAVHALAHLCRQYPLVRKVMIESLSKPDVSNKRAIIEAFGESDTTDSKVIEQMLELLHPSDTQADTFDRQEAAKTLGKIGRHEATTVIPALIDTLTDEDVSVREEVATALGQIGRMSQEETLKSAIIRELTRSLKDDNLAVCVAIINAFKDIEYQTPELVRTLLGIYNDPDRVIQKAVIAALAYFGHNNAEVIHRLCYDLSHAAPVIKREIAAAFKHNDNDTVIHTLLAALNDTDTTVQREVALSLGTMHTRQEEIRSALQKTFLQANDCSLRRVIVTALADIGANESILDALKDPDATVRSEAAFALAQNGLAPSEEILPILRNCLLDPTASTRQRAVTVLGKYGNDHPSVIDALLRMLSDDSTSVRKEAAAMLATIQRERMDVCVLLEKKLQQYAPIARQQFIASGFQVIDATLFALQQAVANNVQGRRIEYPK